MKEARSGVQKLIKNKHTSLYDVGCICHLVDLTIKAGMKTLPIIIDQLFIHYFFTVSKGLLTIGALFSLQSLRQ